MAKAKKKRRSSGNGSDFYDVNVIEVSKENHEQFRADILKGLKEALHGFPKTIEELLNIFKETYPPHIMASFATYSFLQNVGPKGVEPEKTFNDMQPYHGEFLQALLLTIPVEDWGHSPVTPGAMQKVFDIMPSLSTAILEEAIVSTPDDLSEEELTIRELQQRARFYTQGVRNWGYFQDMVRITRELLAPLDDQFAGFHMFSGQELVDVLLAVFNEFERRLNEHFNTLKTVARGKNYRQVIKLYFKHVPDLKGSAEEMISAMPKGISKSDALAMVMSHFDLRLFGHAIFSPEQIAEVSGVDHAKVGAVLSAVSHDPGSLMDSKLEYFFLDNPVWERPGIKLNDDNYFFAMPQTAFSHINRIVARLAKEANLKISLEKRRSDFLEEQLISVMRRALPTAKIRPNVKWRLGDNQYETDLLVVQDRLVLIGEAKSHRFTPEGLRGAPNRIKKHIDDLVIAPSLQSARLETLITDAKHRDQTATEVVKKLGVDPSKVDRVIRFSVTLDDLAELSVAEHQFKKIGWLPEGHQLAPTMLISDLRCIVEILDNPLLFYHYLSERYYFQKSLEVLGDELDFLGLYLVSCLNLARLQQENMRFTPTGMSASIDQYFEGLHTGVSVKKPKVELGKYFQQVVERLGERQPEGWTTVGMHLLSCANPKEQRQLDKEIKKVKAIIRKKYRDPDHTCAIRIRPPEERKALVILHFFPKQLEYQMLSVLKNLAEKAMDSGDIEACAVISQNIDNMRSPYETAVIVTKK